jgi:hypothetical protein
MGLSNDPEVRKRQLDSLAAGRQIAATRRAAGLPRKSREQGEPSRVVDGTYTPPKKPSGEGAKPGAKPAKTRRKPATAKPGKPAPQPERPGRKDRILEGLGRIIGAG